MCHNVTRCHDNLTSSPSQTDLFALGSLAKRLKTVHLHGDSESSTLTRWPDIYNIY